MKKILILFAHPAFHKSRINRKLADAVKNLDGITFNDLYENYPDFYIDRKKEQQLLLENDIIVWHHPFYWYNASSLLKEWFDIVLEYGFAFGPTGKALKGKKAFSVITTGGKKNSYSQTGANNFTFSQFLIPFKQSATLCKMEYFPPFVIHGSHAISPNGISIYAEEYKNLLLAFRDEKADLQELKKLNYLNDKNY